MTGVVHVNHSGTWKAVNFGGQKLWVNHSGTWKEPTAYVKHSGTWKKVYPSDTEAWTTSKLGTQASRQTSSNPPEFSSDPAYIYTNILVAAGDVAWEGTSAPPSADGQWLRVWDFDWSPTTEAGFEYGAVTRVEVVVDGKYDGSAPTGSEYIKFQIGPRTGTEQLSATMTSVYVVYTFDYTVAGWGMTNSEAAALHLNPSSTNGIEINPYFNGGPFTLVVEDLKCRIKYWSN